MRRVKNSFISLVLVIALGLSLVSCNSSKDTLAAGADLSSLATELTSQIEFKDKDLAPLNKELWDRYMTQVDFDDVKNAEIVAGGGFIAEEIALFEAVVFKSDTPAILFNPAIVKPPAAALFIKFLLFISYFY